MSLNLSVIDSNILTALPHCYLLAIYFLFSPVPPSGHDAGCQLTAKITMRMKVTFYQNRALRFKTISTGGLCLPLLSVRMMASKSILGLLRFNPALSRIIFRTSIISAGVICE